MEDNWISVKDGLPPISKLNDLHKVQIFCDPLGVSTGFYWGKTKDTDPCKGWCIMGVSHWQPLPAPPAINKPA